MPTDLAPDPRIVVHDRTGARLPYSRGIMATSLLATGLPTEEAYQLASHIQARPLQHDRSDVDAHELVEIAQSTLDEHASTPDISQRWMAWRSAKRSGRPIIVVLGGAPGVTTDAIREGPATRRARHRAARAPLVELRAFLRAAAGHRYFPILWLAANTGMRRNELIGLKWTDIDFTRQRLALNRGLVAVGYEVHETRGKTKTARRNIALDATTMTVLAGWRTLQAAEFAAVGIDNTEQWMFTNGDGDVVHPHAIYQGFTRIVNNAGVRRIRFHDLRHTHGSLLIQAGVPIKVVSERLGHANIAFTMQTYQHLLPGMQENAADITEQLSAPVPTTATAPVERRGNTRRKTA